MRAVVICIALLGCRDPEVTELERVTGEVCACKTSKCAEQALAEVPHEDQHSTPRTQAIARRMLDCLAKIYDAERDQAPASDDGSGSGSPTPAPAP